MNEKKILIVDDDQHLVLSLAARLRGNGYKVVSATDAISAITVSRKESPDLVILDLGLPAGDGFVVLERLRDIADLMATPVIVLSARDPADNKKRGAERRASIAEASDNHDSWLQFAKRWERLLHCRHFSKT